jgi:hypothetical protein
VLTSGTRSEKRKGILRYVLVGGSDLDEDRFRSGRQAHVKAAVTCLEVQMTARFALTALFSPTQIQGGANDLLICFPGW